MTLGESILLVEEPGAGAGEVQGALRRLGYRAAVVATTGREALRVAEALRPVLALVDLKLDGDLDGLEAGGILGERHGVPSVYLVADGDDAARIRAQATHPCGCLLRPFGDGALRAAIEVALHNHALAARLVAHGADAARRAAAVQLADLKTATGEAARAINGPLATVVANLNFALDGLGGLQRAVRALHEAGFPAATVATLDATLVDLREALAEAEQGSRRMRKGVRSLRALADAEEGGATSHSDATADGAPDLGLAAPPRRGRILVVDDDETVARAIGRMLNPEHDVTIENNARAVLARLHAGETFDVIFSDLMMPDLTGMDLYDAVVASWPELAARMVFVTGGTFTPQAREFVGRVANPTLAKPFATAELRAVARERVR